MARYTVFKNGSANVVFAVSYQDNGWSISDGVAIHDPINSGYLRNSIFRTIPEETYVINMNITTLSGGVLRVYLGSEMIQEINSPGQYSITGVASDNSGISFWSNATVALTDVVITQGETEFRTLLFSDDVNKFVGEVSYTADIMTKFLDDLYSFKDGSLWKHNVNDTRNSFYGVEYPSEITFVFNPDPTKVKNLDSIRIVGNKPWSVSRVYIRPREGKSRGQLSRIKSGDFKKLQGQWFADFKRDLNDPRFTTELERLFKGALLQGEVAEITISINSSDEVKLSSVDIVYDDSMYTY